MKLSKEYIISLFERNIIPQDSWKYEIIDNKTCVTIRNKQYAHLFWLDLWQNILSHLFKNQEMICTIEEIDMTRPIILTEENLELISVQPIVNNIVYFSSLIISNSYNPFLLNITMGNIVIIYTISVIMVMLLSFHIKFIYKNFNILLL